MRKTVLIVTMALLSGCVEKPCLDMAKKVSGYSNVTCSHSQHRMVREGDIVECRCKEISNGVE